MTKYVPTEKQIEQVIQRTGGDARKLAIAYLKASRRARDSANEAKIHSSMTDLATNVMRGDVKGVEGVADKLRRDLHHINDVAQSEKTDD